MSLLSHDRYQYDSLILSKQTWAYPCQHLQQLLWCVVSVRLNLPEVEERKLFPLRYYANCVSTTLKVLILHNVESVYFFYSNPVYYPSYYTFGTNSDFHLIIVKLQVLLTETKCVYCKIRAGAHIHCFFLTAVLKWLSANYRGKSLHNPSCAPSVV